METLISFRMQETELTRMASNNKKWKKGKYDNLLFSETMTHSKINSTLGISLTESFRWHGYIDLAIPVDFRQ